MELKMGQIFGSEFLGLVSFWKGECMISVRFFPFIFTS